MLRPPGSLPMATAPSIVVTLVHGTLLFARWPRLFRIGQYLIRLRRSPRREDIEWHKQDSTFWRRLSKAVGEDCHLTEFEWSGANTVWGRLCAAGAERDFGDGAARPPAAGTLRAHVACMKRRFPDARQVLIAHSHGGNVCLAALRDRDTRAAVQGLACLSTPFVNVRSRADSVVLTDFLQGAGYLVFSAVLFGSIYWVSRRIPDPWDTWLWVAVFMLAVFAWAIFDARTETRRQALRRWGMTRQVAMPETAVFVLLADGDEALLALKIAEGVNAALRGMWRLASVLPLRVFAVQRRWGSEFRVAVVYVAAAVAAFIWLLRNDTSEMSITLVAKGIVVALFVPGVILFAWSLLLALPALLITPIGFVALGLLRWLAFGWGGSFGVEMTAETCPVGTATITRLGPRLGPRGLRHGYSYNDRRSPILLARFIASVANTSAPGRGTLPTAAAADPRSRIAHTGKDNVSPMD